MSQGSEPSAAGGGAGGGMGLGILGSLFGGIGAGSASGATSPSTTPYFIENPSTGTGGQSPGIWDKLGQILQDPEVLKAFGNTAKQLGSTIHAANEIPAHAATMLQQAMQSQQQQPNIGGPYLGDIPNFTPQQAQTLLQAMGIAGGFAPLNRGY